MLYLLLHELFNLFVKKKKHQRELQSTIYIYIAQYNVLIKITELKAFAAFETLTVVIIIVYATSRSGQSKSIHYPSYNGYY